MSLNSPVMTVSWWDAYAYSRFMDRELPTELEWEKAARGEDGLPYPWGKEADPTRTNTNADFLETTPAVKGKVDGHNYWCDVDDLTKDKSPYGVIGMAGNVSEWTADWVNGMNPVIKGGNFKKPLRPMSERTVDRPPAIIIAGKEDESIGFRTVSHKPPKK
jgi:formylglycine-generating enzyme required for sulfatase activity